MHRHPLILLALVSLTIPGVGQSPPRTQQYPFLVSDTALVEWVSRFTGHSLPAKDVGEAITVDDQGNVYVASRVESPLSSMDILTMKYSPAGQELWRAQYNGSTNHADYPSAIAVDLASNVYVTGVTIGEDSTPDILTIKYGPSGEFQWAALYGRSGFFSDTPAGMRVDAQGNVYVTGRSMRWPAMPWVTLKYSTTGEQQWVVVEGDSVFQANTSSNLVLDDSSNVYILGTAKRSLGSQYFDVWKLDKYSAAGSRLWSLSDSGADASIPAGFLARDQEANIYVATDVGGPTRIVKVRSDGSREWTAFPSTQLSLAGMAVDRNGNAFVSTGGDSMVLFKYHKSGSLLWRTAYNAPPSRFIPVDLGTDTSGNVYVTTKTGRHVGRWWDWGDSILTLKYGADGQLAWAVGYSEPAHIGFPKALSVRGSGIVTVVGHVGPYYDFVSYRADGSALVVTYNSMGQKLWEHRMDGEGRSDTYVYDLTVDQEGNVYAVGLTRATGRTTEFFTVKSDPSGQEQWRAFYAGPVPGYHAAYAVAVDEYQNVYVTGPSDGGSTGLDYATIKYGSSGGIAWIARYNSGTNADDIAVDIMVGPEGNVYVTGGTSSYTTVKYSPQGVQQWVISDVPGEAAAMSIAPFGGFFVTGMGGTVKYTWDGVQEWIVPGEFTSMVADISGNVYMTGPVSTKKVNRNGSLQWSVGDRAGVIAIDFQRNVYLSPGAPSIGDATTRKRDQSGNLVWTRSFVATAMRTDPSGNLLLLGGSESDVGIAAYAPAGNPLWRVPYAIPGAAGTIPATFEVDPAGNVYVASSQALGVSSVVVVSKFQQITTSNGETASHVPDRFFLEQNFPNPFNPVTVLRFQIPRSELVNLEVFDLLGRKVTTLVHEQKEPGTHTVEWNGESMPSGVYLVRMTAGNFSQTRKLVLLK